MANISVTIPDAELTRVIAALCKFGGFAPADYTGANAKGVVINFIKMVVTNTEAVVTPGTPPGLT